MVQYLPLFLQYLTLFLFFYQIYDESSINFVNWITYYSDFFAIPITSFIGIGILASFLLRISFVPKHKLWSIVNYFVDSFLIAFCVIFILEMLFERLSVLSGIYILAVLFLLKLCTILGYNMKYKAKLYYILLNLSVICLLGAFSTNNILLFYFFFELALIPMFIIIIVWGSREEKSSAAYQFFLYTLVGSFSLLFGILYLVVYKQTANIYFNDVFQIPLYMQQILFLLFFVGFAVKIPLFPFHLWLPKAHVEAPTVGSILLAGILLKLGSYGFIRFNLLLFPAAVSFYKPLIFTLATLGVLYTVFTILRQIHLKRIIAYSSISHMNFVTLACFSGNHVGLHGGILLTLAHGLASSGLFACVGSIYSRLQTMNVLYLRSLNTIMPILSIFFFIFMLSNIGFPPTLNFLAELFILISLMSMNINIVFLLASALILGTIAGLWIYTKLFFGNFAITKNNFIKTFSDINFIEFSALTLLAVLTIVVAFFSGNINFFSETLLETIINVQDPLLSFNQINYYMFPIWWENKILYVISSIQFNSGFFETIFNSL